MRIHFIGIGGIGMSALARYFLSAGDEVSGSDAAESEIVEELRSLGVKIISNPPNPPLEGGQNPPQPSFTKEGEIPPNLPFTKWGKNAKSPLAPLLQSGEKIDLVIYSAAVREDNPELAEARRLNVKTQKYAEALGEITREKFTIAVSGMHGKSTTTAMIGLILEKAGLDPTVIVGTKVRWNLKSKNEKGKTGKVLNNGIASRKATWSPRDFTSSPTASRNDEAFSYSNFRAGQSQYLVIEADEYDRSFLNYWPKILVLLNIEEEHLDTYAGGLPDIMKIFEEYAGHLSGDGILVANEEDENISKLISGAAPTPTSSPSQREGESQRGWGFRVVVFGTAGVKGLNLKIPGQHNLSNANAALAVARVLGIDKKIAVEALNNFSGAWRRMEYKGELNGAKIYDDYGHHPTEIKATLAGARELLKDSHCEAVGRRKVALRPRRFTRSNPVDTGKITGSPRRAAALERGGAARDDKERLWCVFQPHQYHRTYDLFDKFVGAFGAADQVILLPIYSVAGRESEEIKKQVSSEKLTEALIKQDSLRFAPPIGSHSGNNILFPERSERSECSRRITFLDSFEKAAEYLRKNLQPGDVCVVMGAGDVYKLTNQLLI
ncbi:UDP-N-acetylmuramate--L-alanine ligase [Patescibacteria group bacterium]|nr:UDP-N-acetylmuramate--L-alanine ligase [Patescibacteria group bacterium]